MDAYCGGTAAVGMQDFAWIESYNRHFSERAFDMVEPGGAAIAAGRSTWVAIDMNRRTMAESFL